MAPLQRDPHEPVAIVGMGKESKFPSQYDYVLKRSKRMPMAWWCP